MIKALRTAVACVAVGCLLPACISFNYVRSQVGEPVPDAAVAPLKPQSATLAACLAQLGAPDLVWPTDDGMVNLAYAWTDTLNWGLAASWSVVRFAPVRVDFDSVDTEVKSVVLAFDADLRLHHISRGYLWDLAPSAQQSSAAGRLMRNTPR